MIFGCLLFIGMMAAGYTYNLTFVQLGLEDFGTRVLDLTHQQVARDMALLAVGTCVFALLTGFWMRKKKLSNRFQIKLKIAFGVVLSQTFLTAILPLVDRESFFILWLMGTSLALGVGVPAMFSMTVDLVPVQFRGYAAAAITALAYFAAEVFSTEWSVDFFRRQQLWILGGGTAAMGILAFVKHPWLEQLARQHQQPAFAYGRFVKAGQDHVFRIDRRILAFSLGMFAIYFIDSLGFLRLLKVPALMGASWQSLILEERLFIAGIHVLGAFVAGVLYSALNERQLFAWVFGIFALTHLQYSLHIRVTGESEISLAMPMLYSLAVSLYTVLNFTIWADLSTPQTISVNASLGVALSAWTATFFSTGLALFWEGQGVTLERHIQIVDSLAVLALLTILVMAFWKKKEQAYE